jgi:hypothetical protein
MLHALLHLIAEQDLALYLGNQALPGPPEQLDEERLAQAIAPLTRLTRLCLTGCSLGAIPAEVAVVEWYVRHREPAGLHSTILLV